MGTDLFGTSSHELSQLSPEASPGDFEAKSLRKKADFEHRRNVATVATANVRIWVEAATGRLRVEESGDSGDSCDTSEEGEKGYRENKNNNINKIGGGGYTPSDMGLATVATVATMRQKSQMDQSPAGTLPRQKAGDTRGDSCDTSSPALWRSRLVAMHSTAAVSELGFRDWPRIYQASLVFIERHGKQAEALGWTAAELFGVHPEVGLNRVDCCGALIVARAPVASVTAEAITYANGLVYRRTPHAGPSVPVWEFRP